MLVNSLAQHDPGGMGRVLLTVVANFKPGMEELGCYCTFVAGYPGKDPRDLQRRRPIDDGPENKNIPSFLIP